MKNFKLMSLTILLFAANSACTGGALSSNPIAKNGRLKENFVDEMKRLQSQAALDQENSCGLSPHLYNFVRGILSPLQHRGALIAIIPTYQKCKRARHNLMIHKKIAAAVEKHKEEHEINALSTLSVAHQQEIDKAAADEIRGLFHQLNREQIETRSRAITIK